MILGNYTILNSNPGREIGNFTNLYANFKPSSRYSMYYPDLMTGETQQNYTACIPTGTEAPYNWILAPKGGEMSSSIGMNGSGSIAPSVSLIVGLAITLAGSGNMTAAMSLISGLAITLAGSGALTANLKGTASLECEILVNEGAANAQTIAAAVWNAEAADYNTSGSMGEKLNDAGSAGNPWTDTSTYGAGTKGKLLQDALSTNKFLALK